MFSEARHEADKFRWIESEKAGRDLGEAAIRQWIAQHWAGFLRARVLEHLQGKCFWIELDRDDFGVLARQFPDHTDLVTEITTRFAAGADNLDILCWAAAEKRPMPLVVAILQAIDINGRRFPCSVRTLGAPNDVEPPHIVQG